MGIEGYGEECGGRMGGMGGGGVGLGGWLGVVVWELELGVVDGREVGWMRRIMGRKGGFILDIDVVEWWGVNERGKDEKLECDGGWCGGRMVGCVGVWMLIGRVRGSWSEVDLLGIEVVCGCGVEVIGGGGMGILFKCGELFVIVMIVLV
ncbi:hypothetical protein Tco_0539426 [Tanacetum coccineum]